MTTRREQNRVNSALRVQSAIRGRIRYDVRSMLWRQPRRAAAVETALAHQPGITSAAANPLTGRILIYYDNELNDAAVERLVNQALADCTEKDSCANSTKDPRRRVSSNGTSTDSRHHSNSCGHEHSGGDGHEDVHDRLWNLIAGGSVLAGLLVVNLIPGLGFVAAHPLTFALTSVATVVSGYSFFQGAWRSMFDRGRLNTDALVSSATIASLALGESSTALIVIWLLNLGEYLEGRMLRRARRAIRQLLEVEKKDVWLVVDGQEMRRPLAAVHIADTVAIHSGERLLADGEIVDGSGTLNEAPITGESMPVIRHAGDTVYAGTLLLAGQVKVRITRVGSDTAIGRLIQRVEEAEELRAPIHTTGEHFSAVLVPASFVLAGGVFALTGEIYRALTMLLVACPCAAGLATPTVVSAAIGNGARRGILIKGGVHLEALARVDTVAFDKTGTLTAGLPSVERIIPLAEEYSPEQLLSLAASGELHSQHPLALAVSDQARVRELIIPSHETCEIHIGRGVHADWAGNCVLVGSEQLIRQFDVPIPEQARELYRQHSATGETMMYVTHQSRVVGMIGVRDRIRPEAATTISQLRAEGVAHLLMLTGDNQESARAVAQKVGLTEWNAGLLPEQKYDLIRTLSEQGHRVAVVGDGVNDAPALALADVGIAMGAAGSDVAIEAADIALAADDIRQVPATLALSRQALHLIRQNYAIALGVNAGGIVVSALGAINPFIAAALHNLSTLMVVLNSMRLLRYQPSPLSQSV
ncbi:MAG TPA: cation-translocating P-type ATPase [Candidatus Binataceae bacterium]|nr:cation-translocating P-type ATPase [Candidatus Binataceae bacterium]